MKLARRLEHIDPFYVMECAKHAARIAAGPACDPAQGGEPMIYLNIGEPDFTAPPAVLAAAQRCLAEGRTQYTQAAGLEPLREALSRWYAQRFGLDIEPGRIVITAGASSALQLACLALFEAGDEVLVPDPSYPCNRHFVAAVDAQPVLMPCGAAQRYQPDAAGIARAWTPRTRGVLLASPSNPTGTSIETDEMVHIGCAEIDERALGATDLVNAADKTLRAKAREIHAQEGLRAPFMTAVEEKYILASLAGVTFFMGKSQICHSSKSQKLLSNQLRSKIINLKWRYFYKFVS